MRRQLTVAVFASIGSGVASMLLIALINRALSSDAAALPQIGLEFAACSVLALGARWLAEDCFARVGQDCITMLRGQLAQRIMEAPLSTLERVGAPRLLASLSEDVHAMSHFLTVLPGVLMHAAMLLGCFVYLGVLSMRVFAFVACFLVCGSYAYVRAEGWALKFLRQARTNENRVFDQFRALFEGAKELRLHALRRREFTRDLGESIASVRKLKLTGTRISVGASSAGSFLFFVVIGSVLFVLGDVMALERDVISGYALIFLYVMLPLESLLGTLPTFHQTQVAAEHLKELFVALPSETSTGTDERTRTSAPVRISLRGVTHRYQRDQDEGVFEVGPIDLELEPGKIIFLVGGNGSGKTTLAKLLVGLYRPERGQVYLNGRLTTDDDIEAYRQCFSAVFMDFHLFDSVYGIEPELVARGGQEILAKLQLTHKVAIENGRFSTLALSQGQRKRLALAAAWLEDRPIYVFDEWAADQDPTYKETFYRVLLPELKARGKTVFVITHDDRYFGIADELLKLESGRFTEIHVKGSGSDARMATDSMFMRSEPSSMGGSHELG